MRLVHFVIAIGLLCHMGQAAEVIYVSPQGGGMRDGSSWENAADFQFALTVLAEAGDELWLREGTYYPAEEAGDRMATFRLRNGVEIYGGFSGKERLRAERDWMARFTILSGDIDRNDAVVAGVENARGIAGKNSYSVVTAVGTDETAVLDGVIVQGGMADGLGSKEEQAYYGGGVFMEEGGAMLRNVVLRGNRAVNGGGMSCRGKGSPWLVRVVFTGNVADRDGGGFYVGVESEPFLWTVEGRANTAGREGGGMYVCGADPLMWDVTLRRNRAVFGGGVSARYSGLGRWAGLRVEQNAACLGGGMYVSLSSPRLSDGVFFRNEAEEGGAGLFVSYGGPVLERMVFQGNRTRGIHGSGGAMFCRGGSPALRDVRVIGNEAAFGGGIALFSTEGVGMRGCRVEGNRALDSGGGIYSHHSGVDLKNGVVSANTAGFGAGICQVVGSSMRLVNVEVTRNDARLCGGGMYNQNGSEAEWTQVTVSGNAAGWMGGGVRNFSSGAVKMVNSVLWGNESVEAEEDANLDSSVSASYSLVRGDGTKGLKGGAGMLEKDMDPLFSNPAAGDFRPRAGSPLIDHGGEVPEGVVGKYDGNGAPRTRGARLDVGAYEFDVVFVKADAEGRGDGSSWKDAFRDLQAGLKEARSGQQVWTGAGVYLPTKDRSERGASFGLKNGVKVYGGFKGNEERLEQRDWKRYVTVLSGDIDASREPDFAGAHGVVSHPADIKGKNSFTVVDGSGTDETAVLDGFVITGGQGSLEGKKGDSIRSCGGGVYCKGGSPRLAHLLISGNRSVQGGGMYVEGESFPRLSGVIFRGNTAESGGGLCGGKGSRVWVDRGSFLSNQAFSGGGLYNGEGGVVKLLNSVFSGNKVSDSGAAVFQADGRVLVLNGTFSGNEARVFGGGVYQQGGDVSLENSVFWRNRASSPGLANRQILWKGGELYVISSLVEGGLPTEAVDGGGNVKGSLKREDVPNPMFRNADGVDEVAGTLDDDFRLFPDSPLINAGSNERLLMGMVRDVRGLNRVAKGTVDIGAVEYTPPKIVSEPGSRELDVDQNVVLSVAAQGEDLKYQWYSGSRGEREKPYQDTNVPEIETGFLKEGEYRFWASVEDANDIAYTQTAMLKVKATKKGEWNVAHFGEELKAPEEQETVWGPTADPDGDKMVNAFEYAFGFLPTVFDSSGVIPTSGGFVEGEDGKTRLALYYRRMDPLPKGVGVRVQFSRDLVTWEDVSPGEQYQEMVSGSHAKDELTTVTVVMNRPWEQSEYRYMRVGATVMEP